MEGVIIDPETIAKIIQLGISGKGVKLIKNTKGYNWEIKCLDFDDASLEKLDAANKIMIERYGNKKEEEKNESTPRMG